MKNPAVMLRHRKSIANPIELQYTAEAAGMQQARFQDRVILRPNIDLNDFSCRAVIDWIELEIEVDKPTQFRWIQDQITPILGRKPYVEGLNSGNGNVAVRFRIRLQEAHIFEVHKIIVVLQARFNLAGLPSVSEMEVSIDFTPRQPSDVDRGKLLGVLFRHFHPSRDVMSNYQDRPNHSWGKGFRNERVFYGNRSLEDRLEIVALEKCRATPIDATLYFGEKGSSSKWRLMDKIVDQQNVPGGTFNPLSEADKRVRIEVTLNSEELGRIGISTPEDLNDFTFTKLQGAYFEFMLPTFSNTNSLPGGTQGICRDFLERRRQTTFLAIGVVGLQALDQARAVYASTKMPEMRGVLRQRNILLPQRRRTAPRRTGTLVSYNELTTRVQMALRKLQERERRLLVRSREG